MGLLPDVGAVGDIAEESADFLGNQVEGAKDAVEDVATDEELQEDFNSSDGIGLGDLGAGFKASAELALDKTGIQDAGKEVAKTPTELITGEGVSDEELAAATEDVYGDAQNVAHGVSESIGENVGPATEGLVDFAGEAFVADPIEGAAIATTGVDPATGEEDAYLSAEKAVDPLIFAGTGSVKAGKVGAKAASKATDMGFFSSGVKGGMKLLDEIGGAADDTTRLADETFGGGTGTTDNFADVGDDLTGSFDDMGNVGGDFSGVADDVGDGFDDVADDVGTGADDFSGMDPDEFARVVEDANGPSDEFAGLGDDVGGSVDDTNLDRVIDEGEMTRAVDDIQQQVDDVAEEVSRISDELTSGADDVADDVVGGADDAATGADEAATGADDVADPFLTRGRVAGLTGAGGLLAGAVGSDLFYGDGGDSGTPSPDGNNPSGEGAGESGWGEPQEAGQVRGWTIYQQNHSDGRIRFYAVRDGGSTYLQPQGETGSSPHYFSSEQAIKDALRAWAKKQGSESSGGSSDGSDGSSGSDGSGGSGGSGSGGWSEPERIQSVQGWIIYGQTHPSKGERYFAAGKRDDGGKIYLQPKGETSTEIHYFDSAEALRTALEAWAERKNNGETEPGEEPSGGEPKNPEQDRGGWSEMKHVRKLPLGWHLFGQTHPDKGERYVIAGKEDGTRIYLAKDGTVVEEPVYYTDTASIKEALQAYAKRAENGEARRRPNGTKPDGENVTEDAANKDAEDGIGGFLSSLSTTQKVAGAVAAAGVGYYGYQEGWFDDLTEDTGGEF